MIDQPFSRLIDSLAARTPTPGGGAAAAMAACIGCSLFLMVIRFSRGRKANLDRDGDLQKAEAALQDLLQKLGPMAERDCRSFDAVSAAYAMPKESEPDKQARNQAIQTALIGAMREPELTLAMVRDVFLAIGPVVPCIPKTIASDLATGAALLHAAAEGAWFNVKINAAILDHRELADKTMEGADAVRAAVQQHRQQIAATVDRLLA
jgi:formiminotetrahydrofolate cyclodeaminase